MLIMVDGIDGSGKSTVIEAWENHLAKQGNTIFDLTSYTKEKKVFPQPEETRSYDFIFSSEPTRVGIGKVIREELTNKNNDYGNEAIVQAFALDRLILYKKIIVPLLEDKRCVISDRGISTTFAYQTLPGGGCDLETVARLPGNKLSLAYCPDHLVLLQIAPELAAERIAKRENKKDRSIFEKLETLRALTARFVSEEYLQIFKSRGTQIHYLPAHEKIDIMRTEAIELLIHILK